MPVEAQVRPIEEQLEKHAPQCAFEVIDTQLPPQHALFEPQLVPFATVREHPRDSGLFTLAQLPAWQRRSVRVRPCVPVVSHAFANPPQLPQPE